MLPDDRKIVLYGLYTAYLACFQLRMKRINRGKIKHLKPGNVWLRTNQDCEDVVEALCSFSVIPSSISLLPLFLPPFLKRYPSVKLKIQEQTTDQLLSMLSSDKIDVGIMATPVGHKNFKESPLFYEEFKVFVSANDKNLKKKYILPEDIDINKLWLLEEGHCLRSQTLNLCELQKQQAKAHNLDYEAGSIESLLKITDYRKGAG